MQPTIFSSYEELLKKLDVQLQELPGLQCPTACDECCRLSLTVFPVEAYYLRAAFQRLTESERLRVLEKTRVRPEAEACLLLADHRCMLYPCRPVLCRTYGYPLLGRDRKGPEGWSVSPSCPRSRPRRIRPASGRWLRFKALPQDPINDLLVAVNRLFIRQAGLEAGGLPLRVPIAKIPELPPLVGDPNASL